VRCAGGETSPRLLEQGFEPRFFNRPLSSLSEAYGPLTCVMSSEVEIWDGRRFRFTCIGHVNQLVPRVAAWTVWALFAGLLCPDRSVFLLSGRRPGPGGGGASAAAGAPQAPLNASRARERINPAGATGVNTGVGPFFGLLVPSR